MKNRKRTAPKRSPKRRAGEVPRSHEPGDIVAYGRQPRRGEILCHNHVIHTSWMVSGVNGFRFFCCRAGGHWKVCPCGWRPDLGAHHARPDHVAWTRKMLKKLGSQEAFDRYIVERAPEAAESALACVVAQIASRAVAARRRRFKSRS